MGNLLAIAPAAPLVSASSEVPGLRDALKAEKAAQERVVALGRRAAEARAEVDLRGKDRAALLGQAALGHDVAAAALRRADEAIGDADAAVTLAEAALPGAEAAAATAEKAVAEIRNALFRGARSRLLREYHEAEAKCEEAKAEWAAAGERAGVWHPMGSGAPLPPDVQAEINATVAAHR